MPWHNSKGTLSLPYLHYVIYEQPLNFFQVFCGFAIIVTQILKFGLIIQTCLKDEHPAVL